MKTIEELKEFYDQSLLPTIMKLEEHRKKTVNKLVMTILPILIITGICAIIFAGTKDGVGLSLGIGIFAAIAAYMFIIKGYVSRFKEVIIKPLVDFMYPGLTYSKDGYITFNEFEQSEIFQSYINRYSGDDLVDGRIEKTELKFSEIHAQHETRSGKNRRVVTIFKGLFFIGDFNKHFKGKTLVLPDVAEKAFGSMGSMFQKMTIGRPPLVKLEDPEFEREFVVYSTDQVEARYILSSSLMRRIYDFKTKSRRKIYLSFIDSKVFVAIWYSKNLFEPKIFESLINFAPIAEYYEDLKLALGIVEDLNLNTRIWTKE